MKFAYLLSLLLLSTVAQSINQSTNQSINRPTNPIGNRTTNNIRSINQPTNHANYQLTDRLIDQLPPGIPTLTINIYSNFSLPPRQSINQSINAIMETYPPINQPKTVRKYLPRFYGPEFQIDYNDPVPNRSINRSTSQPTNQSTNRSLGEWVKGTVFYAIPGAIIAIIILGLWISLIIRHCCRSTNQSINQSTNQSINQSMNQSTSLPTVLLIVLIGCSIVVFVFSVVGLAYNNQLTNGLTNGDSNTSINQQPVNQPTNQSTNQSLSVISWEESDPNIGLVTAVDKSINDLLEFTNQFNGLINRLIDQLIDTIPRINNQLIDASGIINQFDQLMRQFLTINQSINQFSIGNYSCASSPACQSINQPINQLMDSVSDVVFPVLSVIDNDIQSIQTNLISINQSINDQLYSAIDQITNVRTEVINQQSNFQSINQSIRKYDRLRYGLTLAFFLLPIVLLIGALIICLYKYCTHRSINQSNDQSIDQSIHQSSKPILRRSLLLRICIHLLCFVALIDWLMFCVHLCVTSAISDTCQFTDAYQQSINQQLDPNVANVVTACLLNTSLITALDIDQSINFAIDVVIPNVTSINQIFPIDQLVDALNQTEFLNLDSFGYSSIDQSAYRAAALQQVNQITAPDVYTDQSINQLNVNSYPSNQRQVLTALKSGIILSINADQSINQFINQFRANLSDSLNLVSSISQSTTPILTNFLSVGETVAPLIDHGVVLVESAYCGVLGNNAGAAKHSYCQTVLQAVGLIDVSTFIIGILCLPLIACLCFFESWCLTHQSINQHQQFKSPAQTPMEQSVNMSPMNQPTINQPTYQPAYQPTYPTYHPTINQSTINQPTYQSTGYLPAIPPRPSAPSQIITAEGGYIGEPNTI